ncbi:hypothetical protein QQS21_010420 [Conoideocrella luteorostrata]|uniref:Uncharacterized protein n=1 Tax=Conoideocrella luteorostrata TaxID=1105319 RepID=A0AAJ0FPE1_9HYPO|nr:hypothetical protein QQS21_010420 [Conoideocrella luteorostrata]
MVRITVAAILAFAVSGLAAPPVAGAALGSQHDAAAVPAHSGNPTDTTAAGTPGTAETEERLSEKKDFVNFLAETLRRAQESLKEMEGGRGGQGSHGGKDNPEIPPKHSSTGLSESSETRPPTGSKKTE